MSASTSPSLLNISTDKMPILTIHNWTEWKHVPFTVVAPYHNALEILKSTIGADSDQYSLQTDKELLSLIHLTVSSELRFFIRCTINGHGYLGSQAFLELKFQFSTPLYPILSFYHKKGQAAHKHLFFTRQCREELIKSYEKRYQDFATLCQRRHRREFQDPHRTVFEVGLLVKQGSLISLKEKERLAQVVETSVQGVEEDQVSTGV